MAEINDDAKIDVTKLGIPDDFVVEIRGAQTLIYGKPDTTKKQIDALKSQLANKADGRYTVMSGSRRDEVSMPVTSRTGDIMLELLPPAYFVGAKAHDGHGAHGFDNTLDDMGATFIAAGPAFKKGMTLPPMKNLEVFPGLAKVMKLEYVPQTDSGSKTFEQGLIK